MTPALEGSRRSVRSILLYLQATLLAALILVLALELWKADLRVPFYYTSGGDVHFYMAMNKTVAETGWYFENPMLGAPGTMKLYDFPIAETGTYLGIRLLTAIVRDPFLAGNLFYLFTYFLVTWTALYVLLVFGVHNQVAVAASLLFSFMPYHLWRGTCHLPFTSYFPIPLIVMVALRLAAGQELLFRRTASAGVRPAWIPGRTLPAISACVLIGLAGPYQAYFGSYLLLVAGTLGLLRKRSLPRMADGATMLGLAAGCFVLQTIPFVIGARRQGPNPGAFHRVLENYYIFALNSIDMFRPVIGHRIPAFSNVSALGRMVDQRDLSYLLSEFNEGKLCAPLGLLGGFSLLLTILVALGAPFPATRRNPALGDASKLSLGLLILGIRGGLGELIAVFVTMMIRCYNRMSIFLAFLALFVLASIVSDWANMERSAGGGPVRWRKTWLPFLAWLVTAFALLDQVPSGVVPDYARDAAHFRGDDQFVRRIEQSLKPGAMVFQLPAVQFPEQGKKVQMSDYNHFRGFFHSHAVHWSFGAMRGREIQKLQSSLDGLPAPELVSRLTELGFAGIYVNRKGFEESDTRNLIDGLTLTIRQAPIRNDDGELLFFTLPGRAAGGSSPGR